MALTKLWDSYQESAPAVTLVEPQVASLQDSRKVLRANALER